MNLKATYLKRFKTLLAHGTVALLLGLGTGQVMAANLAISDKPLDTLEGVPANIILTMDDSGSMAWGFLPDGIGGYCPSDWSSCTDLASTGTSDDLKRATSASVNKIYYDPTVTYTPAVDANGASLGDATFTAAWNDGFNQGGSTTNLSNDFEPPWHRGVYFSVYNITNSSYSGAAFYHVYDSSNVGCTGTVDDNTCYDKVVVSSTSGPGNTDERTNFANWYSYYRYRQNLAKTAASRAFSQLSGATRVAYQALNSSTTLGTLQPLSGTNRTDFFNWIYDVPANGGTALRYAFKRAGEKFSTDEAYEKEPGVSGTPTYSCRQNFHFAFTDGEWNGAGSNVTFLNGVNYTDNYDGGNSINITLPETVNGVSNYIPRSPYSDANGKYLGDIALYFWANDLSNLTNDVPQYIIDKSDYDSDGDTDDDDIFWNPKNNPATWQHMVSFTIGFGVAGNLAFPADYDALVDGTQSWGSNVVDDLWHAAINSRGDYFSASDPDQLVNSFASVLAAIDARSGSSSAVATTSSQYQTGTNLFQAIYDPSTWAGDLVARDVVTLAQQWSAATVLAQQIDGTIASPRVIITNNGGGVPFQWADISASQKLALQDGGVVADGQSRLAYLRGDASDEQKNGGSFRNRVSALGDIVHSDPFFLPPPGAPLFFWPDNLESVAYSSFVAGKSGRMDMVLFGGNDGMLHIVNASNGREILGYVPGPVIANLSKLTDPTYSHKFYVDQAIQIMDVFYGGAWHTVGIGGLGKGGQGIYALDLTNPSTFLESNAANIVMWEFTDANDADLGYSYTRPQMFKMNNDKWMVVFGNGHSNTEADGNASANGDALLFLLDIENGGQGSPVVKFKLSTETGTAEDPTGLGRANRLTDIVALDKNEDYKVDLFYAGDLFGNVWKFDVSSSTTSQWEVVKAGNSPTPLFTATDESGNPQPITVAPIVQYHSKQRGQMVYVGTGKYLETSDTSDTSIQTIYGIWDRDDSGIDTIERRHLLEQKILESNYSQFTQTNARLTTDNGMSWYDGNNLPNGNPPTEFLGWYMDLIDTEGADANVAKGERIVDDLYVSGERLEFITLIPSTNPCVGGGESWLFALNAMTGSRFISTTPWDYNSDGRYDTDDKVNYDAGQIWGSGINFKTPQRFRKTKLLKPGSDCQEINILNNSDGSITTVTGNCIGNSYGRRSWRQIKFN